MDFFKICEQRLLKLRFEVIEMTEWLQILSFILNNYINYPIEVKMKLNKKINESDHISAHVLRRENVIF